MPDRVAFLACPTTLPDSPRRRDDAHEHDLEVAAIAAPLARRGVELTAVDWADPRLVDAGFAGALIGTTWDYDLRLPEFLDRLRALAGAGTAVWNDPEVVAWNSDKRYLEWLADRGVDVLPTVWIDRPDAPTIEDARRALGAADVVVKRQVGAGARGQVRFQADDPVTWNEPGPVMVQAFEPAITEEGEWSMVFVDGELSHALRKRPADGDYRIQSLYGGIEQADVPSPDDLDVARRALAAVPGPPLLHARVDLVRRADGRLALMELEVIEPYLYPEQGPDLGERVAAAIARRLVPGGPLRRREAR